MRGDVDFYPSALKKGVRSEQALKLALAEMYVQGVSTRKVSAILEQLCGTSLSSTQVSQCAARLDAELEIWRTRPLETCAYLIIDARYEKVRDGGCVLDCAVLITLGIRPDGKRSVLGVSVALSEAEVHWREFLQSLQKRGLHGVQLIISDDHAGLRAAGGVVAGRGGHGLPGGLHGRSRRRAVALADERSAVGGTAGGDRFHEHEPGAEILSDGGGAVAAAVKRRWGETP